MNEAKWSSFSIGASNLKEIRRGRAFCVDLTWNDPIVISYVKSEHEVLEYLKNGTLVGRHIKTRENSLCNMYIQNSN